MLPSASHVDQMLTGLTRYEPHCVRVVARLNNLRVVLDARWSGHAGLQVPGSGEFDDEVLG